jgi:branched-subunit amino acid aminotransferase/4-amino-4-deoxychorismate lyase
MTLLGPYLEFFGVEKVTALFRKRENMTRLLDRIDELEMERSRKREEAKRKKRKEKSPEK